ncbi:ciliary microtubule inner protein 1-like [Magallana gigas]|uniref:Uncharacterized protein n=1 Tax=Magallana gigas TaxID=29159 RepID=A0A8W8IBQ0_MAGGI|nr:uncharacterized protein C20orf85-like [Crassostrea gigas]
MAASSNVLKNHINFVHNDEIWKDHVRHESISQRRIWPKRWGYLVQEYKLLSWQLKHHQYQPPTQSGSVTRGLKLPPIHPPRPRTGFPMTSTQQIGWRSSRKECQLEKYGRYGPGPRCRGRYGILKMLNWPQEGSP